MVKVSKFCHVTPILKFLHWLKINGRIEYKRLSLMIPTKLLPLLNYLSAQPDLCSAPRVRATRFCCHPLDHLHILLLRITNRSFRYASPHLWNQLPVSFRQLCTKHPADDTHSLIHLTPAHHSHPLSHIHCFIRGSKLTFSTIFSTIVELLHK